MIARARHVATVEIAGLVLRLACRYPKPALWARELHPDFLSRRAPQTEIRFTYAERHWAGEPPWVADNSVVDTPDVTDEGGALLVTSSYYTARLRPGRVAAVRLAAGFQVDGPMRALVALLLSRRDGRLVRGRRVVDRDRAVLVCAPRGPASMPDSELVAVVRTRSGYRAWPTPFGSAPTLSGRDRGLPLAAVRAPTSSAVGDPSASLSRGRAVALLVSCVYTVDRRPAAQAATLEWASRLAGARDVACVADATEPIGVAGGG